MCVLGQRGVGSGESEDRKTQGAEGTGDRVQGVRGRGQRGGEEGGGRWGPGGEHAEGGGIRRGSRRTSTSTSHSTCTHTRPHAPPPLLCSRHLDTKDADPEKVSEAVEQVAYADRLLINKTDLVRGGGAGGRGGRGGGGGREEQREGPGQRRREGG